MSGAVAKVVSLAQTLPVCFTDWTLLMVRTTPGTYVALSAVIVTGPESENGTSTIIESAVRISTKLAWLGRREIVLAPKLAGRNFWSDVDRNTTVSPPRGVKFEMTPWNRVGSTVIAAVSARPWLVTTTLVRAVVPNPAPLTVKACRDPSG